MSVIREYQNFRAADQSFLTQVHNKLLNANYGYESSVIIKELLLSLFP